MKLGFAFSLALISVLATAAWANPTACLDGDKGETAEVSGTVKKVLFPSANGDKTLTAWMLTLDKPICYTVTGLDSAKVFAFQDSEIQVTGNTQSLVSGSTVRLRGQVTGNNITQYYLSSTAIELE